MEDKIKDILAKYSGVANVFSYASNTVKSLVSTSIELDNQMAQLRAYTGLTKDEITNICKPSPYSLNELKKMAMQGYDIKIYLKDGR